MSQTITLDGPTRAVRRLGDTFEFGQGERLGVTDAAHAATWHMAGMIEHLHAHREVFAERLRRGELGAGPVPPDEEPTT